MRLHGYWRSGAAYRVRIGLNLKGLAYDHVPVNLLEGEQAAPAYRALNPLALVPTLEAGGLALTQSLAILEWLDEIHPQPPLLPGAPADRAIVRAMAAIIACDTAPLNNLRVLSRLRTDFAADEQQVAGWIRPWIAGGLGALEAMAVRHAGRFLFGDTPGIADCCLIPQLYSAARFEVDLTPYPSLLRVRANADALEAFAEAHPSRQPDAPA
jgi:maleylpyruvate isomerase